MMIIGLTGAIGMGKSAVAAMLKRLRIPLYDADQAVHDLYRDPLVIKAVSQIFPAAVIKGELNRGKLADIVFHDPLARMRLTSILYPLLARRERRFLQQQARLRAPLAVMDIPLLFETGGERRVDATLVVNAPYFIQYRRVLTRTGMTDARFAAIEASQIPQHTKCQRADIVVSTGLSRAVTFAELRRALRLFKQKLAPRRLKWDTLAYARNRSGY